MTEALIDRYDAALFDLDGVLYLGPVAVPGAAEGVAGLRERGVKLGFVTNNAARPPEAVTEQLTALGMPCVAEDVVTSGQALIAMLRRELPAGSKVFVAGTQALADQATAAAFQVVGSFRDEPVAVLQGYHPHAGWQMFNEAAHAIQRGAVWYASNTDSTRPTELGLVPGAGSQIGVVATSVEVTPRVAGKPYPPLLNETVLRLATSNPIFVGDRCDTDIEGAHNVGMDSLFVLSGVHGKSDLVNAKPARRPTWIGQDVRALLAPAREARLEAGSAVCGEVTASVEGRAVVLSVVPVDLAGQLDALWALLQLAWADGNLDATAALQALDQVH